MGDIVRYEIAYGFLLTRIDVFGASGCWVRTVYVHRAEYRHWGA